MFRPRTKLVFCHVTLSIPPIFTSKFVKKKFRPILFCSRYPLDFYIPEYRCFVQVQKSSLKFTTCQRLFPVNLEFSLCCLDCKEGFETPHLLSTTKVSFLDSFPRSNSTLSPLIVTLLGQGKEVEKSA